MTLPFPTFANVQNAAARKAPSDLASWSEAAVCDRLFEFYSAAIADSDFARQATRLHWSCWRAYLNQLVVQGRVSRQALMRMVNDARLDPALIDRADVMVADELTDMVLQKHRRAPRQAKTYINHLVATATQMALGRGV
jgi:hypothetical protein